MLPFLSNAGRYHVDESGLAWFLVFVQAPAESVIALGPQGSAPTISFAPR